MISGTSCQKQFPKFRAAGLPKQDAPRHSQSNPENALSIWLEQCQFTPKILPTGFLSIPGKKDEVACWSETELAKFSRVGLLAQDYCVPNCETGFECPSEPF